MFHKNTTNDNNYYPTVIGDILLHSEIKLIPIQVQILTTISPQINEKINKPRLLPSSCGLLDNQSELLCDLKNSTIDKLTHERILSSKRLMRIHKLGWEFVKELKSKVITINNNESKISMKNMDSNNEQTHF